MKMDPVPSEDTYKNILMSSLILPGYDSSSLKWSSRSRREQMKNEAATRIETIGLSESSSNV
jgi:hypothetical protein